MRAGGLKQRAFFRSAAIERATMHCLSLNILADILGAGYIQDGGHGMTADSSHRA